MKSIRQNVATILLIGIGSLQGQGIYSWLYGPAHPRQLGLANAAVAGKGLSLTAGLNPAGLARLTERRIHFAHRWYPAAIRQTTFSMARPGSWSVKGIELRHMAYGKFAGYNTEGNPQGDYHAGDIWLGMTRAATVGNLITLGVGGGVLFSQIGEYIAGALLASWGAQMELPAIGTRIGLISQGHGSLLGAYGDALQPDRLARLWLAGISTQLEHLPLTLHLSGGYRSDDPAPLWRIGGEFSLGPSLLFRFGIDEGKTGFHRGSANLDLLSGFAFGIGYRTPQPTLSLTQNLGVDFAFRLLGPLGFTSALSIGLVL